MLPLTTCREQKAKGKDTQQLLQHLRVHIAKAGFQFALVTCKALYERGYHGRLLRLILYPHRCQGPFASLYHRSFMLHSLICDSAR